MQAEDIVKSEADKRNAGMLYALSGTVMLLVISLAEALYPGYSVHTNAISDLAATTANTAGLVGFGGLVWGLGWLAGSYLLLRGARQKRLLLLFILPAVGVLMAILSPENVNVAIHSVGAIVAFVPGAASAIFSFRLIRSNLKYLALALGLMSLAGTIVEFGGYYSTLVQVTLGPGGAERIIVYPLLAWLIVFGGYLAASEETRLGRQ